jgi:hypothetical protein
MLTMYALSVCLVTVLLVLSDWASVVLPTVTSSAKINKEGIWIEKLDDNPGELIPAELRNAGEGDVVKIT